MGWTWGSGGGENNTEIWHGNKSFRNHSLEECGKVWLLPPLVSRWTWFSQTAIKSVRWEHWLWRGCCSKQVLSLAVSQCSCSWMTPHNKLVGLRRKNNSLLNYSLTHFRVLGAYYCRQSVVLSHVWFVSCLVLLLFSTLLKVSRLTALIVVISEKLIVS